MTKVMTARRRWVRRGVWIGCAVAATVALLVFDHLPTKPPVVYQHEAVSLPGYSSNGTLEQPSAADIAQVKKALATRAHAVLDGDRAAFLGVVDTADGAFTAQQRTVWDNTRHLPFDVLSYTYDGTVEPDTPLSTPTFLARVTTSYVLKGFDESPVEVDDGFSFVKQGGSWKLASVSQSDAQFGQSSLPVPWEGPPITTYRDAMYLAIVDRGRTDLARHLVALCHEASRTSGQLLGVVNTRPTVVIATSHSRGFRRFTGPDAAAVVYRLTSPSGSTAGWRLVLNPSYVDDVVASPVVLKHEFTHLAMQDLTPYLPQWLTEGTAEYVGWHSSGGLPVALRYRGFLHPRALPARLPISAGFYLDDVQLNYSEGMALVSWIDQHRGRQALVSLFSAYHSAEAADPDYDPDTATPVVLHRVLGMTPEALARAAYQGMNEAVAK